MSWMKFSHVKKSVNSYFHKVNDAFPKCNYIIYTGLIQHLIGFVSIFTTLWN